MELRGPKASLRLSPATPSVGAFCHPRRRASRPHFLPVGNRRPEMQNIFLPVGNSAKFPLTTYLANALASGGDRCQVSGVRGRCRGLGAGVCTGMTRSVVSPTLDFQLLTYAHNNADACHDVYEKEDGCTQFGRYVRHYILFNANHLLHSA